eukprot:jgi/Chlat1/7371/Chrsp6S07412
MLVGGATTTAVLGAAVAVPVNVAEAGARGLGAAHRRHRYGCGNVAAAAAGAGRRSHARMLSFRGPMPVLAQAVATAPEVAKPKPNYGSGLDKLYRMPQRGKASPLGATLVNGGVNFAIYAGGATAVSLCLFTEEDLQQGKVTAEIPMDRYRNCAGDVWHMMLPLLTHDLLYGYRVSGPTNSEDTPADRYDPMKIVLDPYAKAVVSRWDYGKPKADGNCWPQFAGAVPHPDDEFDWEGDAPLHRPMDDTVIYEMHVRGFTRHKSSNTPAAGTYAGIVDKLPHLKALGVTAIELLPIHEFNELEYYSRNPVTRGFRVNYWGYSSVNFFSPMSRYACADKSDTECGRGVIREFKQLVKECHKQGIEVILDVVFNHTGEGNENGPTLSFRGLDNRTYYMLAPEGQFYNYSGCGNTFNCNHPVVRRFIIDCLRYWVTEMHVDGFRFDLASILTRASSLWEEGTAYGVPPEPATEDEEGVEPDLILNPNSILTGTPLDPAPLIELIGSDGILRSTKLIAEAWDAGGLYQVGSFPRWGQWSEWNGKFRDAVRNFVKGTDGVAGEFAARLCGSPDLYQESGGRPRSSINFITAHDGFSLYDLVSYNDKHNLSNGENNMDGENHNLSWNCGAEGEFVPDKVQRLRRRQMRNFVVAMMISQARQLMQASIVLWMSTTSFSHDGTFWQGVPMIQMGDEYGHTKGGNNNTYCHDSEVNWFRWDKLEKESTGFQRFFTQMIEFRKQHPVLRLPEFPNASRLSWHGLTPGNPDWSESSRFVALKLGAWELGGDDLYIAFNASHLPVVVAIPNPAGRRWVPVVDTGKVAPYDFMGDDVEHRDVAHSQYESMIAENLYPMMSYSSIVLKAVATS